MSKSISTIFLLILVISLIIIELGIHSQIYVESNNNNLSIYTHNIQASNFNLIIKPLNYLTHGTKYTTSFSYAITDINADDISTSIYPNLDLNKIKNIQAHYENGDKVKHRYGGNGPSTGTGNPLIFDLDKNQNYKNITIEFECETCSYSGIILSGPTSKISDNTINVIFDLKGNIIEGIQHNEINDQASIKLIERKKDTISINIENISSITVPIFLTVKNEVYINVEIIILSILGAAIYSLLEKLLHVNKKKQ